MKANFLKIRFVVMLYIILSIMFLTHPLLTSEVQAADKVTFRLHWKVSGMHVPLIVAMDKGFYKDEGIDISIKEGTGSTVTLKLIGVGEETLGIAGTNVTVKGIAVGVPVLQIMVLEASKQQGILSRPEANINEPKDLIGKTIAGSGSGTSDVWEAFLDVNKLPKGKVDYLAAGTARLEAVASGRADGTLGLGMDDISILQRMGIKNPKMLLFSNFGIPDCGDGVITHLDTVKKNPDMIRRFVRASIRGINYTNANIEEAANIALKHFPMTDKSILLEQLHNTKILYPVPLGWQDPKIVEELRDLSAKYENLPQAKDIPLSKFFTNEFLPK